MDSEVEHVCPHPTRLFPGKIVPGEAVIIRHGGDLYLLVSLFTDNCFVGNLTANDDMINFLNVRIHNQN